MNPDITQFVCITLLVMRFFTHNTSKKRRIFFLSLSLDLFYGPLQRRNCWTIYDKFGTLKASLILVPVLRPLQEDEMERSFLRVTPRPRGTSR